MPTRGKKHGGLQKKKKGHHPLACGNMRLHELTKALFVRTCAAKPRFLFGSGYSCS